MFARTGSTLTTKNGSRFYMLTWHSTSMREITFKGVTFKNITNEEFTYFINNF